MEIIFVSLLLSGLLYLIYQSVQKKRSLFLTLLFIVLFIAIPAFLSFILGSVRAQYSGQSEWVREKAFFLGMFADKLEETNDLKTAAESMQSEAIKEQTLQCIQQIVLSFRPKTVFYLSIGGLILLLSVISLWIKRIAEKKYYPFLLVFFVLVGGILFDIGIHYCQYASRTDGILKNFLRLQQQDLMKDLSGRKTDLSIPEIISITRKEAGRLGFGYGQRIINQMQKKGEQR